MIVFNLSTLIDQLFVTKLSLISLCLLVLAIEITFRNDYVYPENYITRSSPTYKPSTSFEVPDNACQRSINKSPLIFDFIIVGSGPAGSVLANRLSENPGIKVLLIEAGKKPPLESIPPFFFSFVLNASESLFPYHAEVTENTSLAYNDGCQMHSGKTLGGSTSIGALFWVCGNNRDYNSWSEAGATGWDYESVLPFFRKIENNLDSSKSSKYHGRDGPLTISSNTDGNPFTLLLKRAWNQLGYKTIHDYNSESYNGITKSQSTVKKGERQNSYLSYLRPIINRKNLFFATEATATNLIFNGTTAKAVNVRTDLKDCPNIEFIARKEIILSAGTFGTPKILMQSGVGPKELLARLGIPLVRDLPVGKNFQDHVTGVNMMKLYPNAKKQSIVDIIFDGVRYLLTRKGSFAQLGTTHATAFINISDVNAIYPEVYSLPVLLERNQQFLSEILANFGFKDEIISKLLSVNESHQILLTFITLLNPKSTGTVELRGNDPNLPPKIISGIFTDPEGQDHETLAAGMNKLTKLIKTEAFENTGAEFIDFDFPLCRLIPFATKDYWKCYVKYFSGSEWHFSGTSKMGSASDPTAVVDPTLKVRGINNLRVVDASVMPTIPSGNTQCAVYMIGEKGADMIKREHNL